ncbi:DUF6471 domain-containing protein [Castellaniella sp. GW247-6E4]|uniref:DUF6471 domain-containing protein n=1 Tax=Castellaniella sp. GW247-6E4 TaxID=3140380 RepID=UPI0033162C4E
MSSPPDDEQALLSRAVLREEVVLFTKKLIVREMKAQKLTYQALADRLAPYGIHDSAPVLTTKIFRGTFSATFLITCLKALDVRWIDLGRLDPTVKGRELRRRREDAEKATRQHYQQKAQREKREQKAMRRRAKLAKMRATRTG